MQLADYQKIFSEKLYDELVDYERQLILFTGVKGCGKSIIIGELSDSLKENWKVFIIAGTGEANPPYYTWYSSTEKPLNSVKTRISDISFGVNFEPIQLPIGIEIGFCLSSENLQFNNNELAILKLIKNKMCGKEHVLFIADDYSSWDLASKELLMKIIITNPSPIGDGIYAHAILVDSFITKDKMFSSLDYTEFQIHPDDVSLNDIEHIVKQQPYIKALQMVDLENIIPFTGLDLRLINMAAHYHQENTDTCKIQSLKELLEKRISYIPEDQKTVYLTLEHVSIIESSFTEKEAAYLLDKEPYHAEKILDDAVNLNLIRKRNAYDFPNSEIQKYFTERLDSKKKYLHHSFAKYLQRHFPEDYVNRSYHLFLSERANDDSNALEAAYLMAIEIVHRKELTGGMRENALEKRLDQILNSLPSYIAVMAKGNIDNFNEGHSLLYQCEYAQAIISFESLHFTYATEAFSIEALRLLLLSNVQLADDLHRIKEIADKLYGHIFDSQFYEDELWCRAALLLLEVYGDRHVDFDKFKLLESGFEKRFKKHMNQRAFRTLHAKFACKSALFCNPMISVKFTEESCEYFRLYNNITHLYFGLCNNAANHIICGDYAEAKTHLQECKEIISNNPMVFLPSTYKIENNMIVNDFLQKEGELFNYEARKREAILPAASAAAGQLKLLTGKQGYEVSHVIELNLLSMLLLIGDEKNASEIICRYKKEYKSLDVFYRYYYHNACCASSLLAGNFDKANKHLEVAENMEVVLLAPSAKILNQRNQMLHQLIDERFGGDAFDYNYEFMKRGFRIQDPSSSFWGRGLLLSDLQFLSY